MEVVHILLQDFAQHLTSQNASTSTVKNYIADIGLFFRFLENHDRPVTLLTLPHQLFNPNISSYHQYLISRFPPSTVKRRISSLNKFVSFANSSRPVSPIPPISNFQSSVSELPVPIPPSSHAKGSFSYTFALFILLIISLSVVSGLIASRLAPSAPIGLVDPGVSHISP